MPGTLPGNWYQVLGVPYLGATAEEIKLAYKELTVKLHIDKKRAPQGEDRKGKGRTARHRGPKTA